MELSPKTKIGALVAAYPFLLDYLAARSPAFEKLRNPLLLKTVAKIAPISQAASMGGLDETELLFGIAAEIYRTTGESVTVVGREGGAATAGGAASESGADDPGAVEPISHGPQGREQRVKVLKDIVMRLHKGEPVDEVRAEFHELLAHVSPAEIGAMEQELVKEGVPESEIKRLCELHVELFTAATKAPELPDVPPGHPLHTYRAENREAEAKAAALQDAASLALDPLTFAAARGALRTGLADLAHVVRHYERKENQLFPIMERHGLTAPPQVMWEIHDDIRKQLKQAAALLDAGDPAAAPLLAEACVAVRDMVFKEERILFPMVWATFSEADWGAARHGEEDIGFAWVAPGDEWRFASDSSGGAGALASGTAGALASGTVGGAGALASGATGAAGALASGTAGGADRLASAAAGLVELDAGRLRPEVVNAILKTLPVDLSFVDAGDRVAYFSQTEERIFPRSPGIIGRDVSKCHPPKSVHMVEEILRKFRSGERDTAEFWIELGGRFVHIRYFAVRQADGTYEGCLEVSQDVTAIRALTGQRRLLEWS